MLTADAVQLFRCAKPQHARPATAPGTPAWVARSKSVGSKLGRGALKVTGARALAAGIGHVRRRPESGTGSGDAGSESEDEGEGDVLSMVISLSQITDVALGEGGALSLTFTNAEPVRQPAAAAARVIRRSILFPLSYPLKAARSRRAVGMRAYFSRRTPALPPSPATNRLELHATEAAATELAAALAAALARLDEAVHWLDRGLPLVDTPAAVACTIQEARGRAPRRPAEVLALLPAWGQRMRLPLAWSRRTKHASLNVLLSTPLGPAEAVLLGTALLESSAASGSPVTTVARLAAVGGAGAAAENGEGGAGDAHDRLQVELQWCCVGSEATAMSDGDEEPVRAPRLCVLRFEEPLGCGFRGERCQGSV